MPEGKCGRLALMKDRKIVSAILKRFSSLERADYAEVINRLSVELCTPRADLQQWGADPMSIPDAQVAQALRVIKEIVSEKLNSTSAETKSEVGEVVVVSPMTVQEMGNNPKEIRTDVLLLMVLRLWAEPSAD